MLVLVSLLAQAHHILISSSSPCSRNYHPTFSRCCPLFFHLRVSPVKHFGKRGIEFGLWSCFPFSDVSVRIPGENRIPLRCFKQSDFKERIVYREIDIIKESNKQHWETIPSLGLWQHWNLIRTEAMEKGLFDWICNQWRKGAGITAPKWGNRKHPLLGLLLISPIGWTQVEAKGNGNDIIHRDQSSGPHAGPRKVENSSKGRVLSEECPSQHSCDRSTNIITPKQIANREEIPLSLSPFPPIYCQYLPLAKPNYKPA